MSEINAVRCDICGAIIDGGYTRLKVTTSEKTAERPSGVDMDDVVTYPRGTGTAPPGWEGDAPFDTVDEVLEVDLCSGCEPDVSNAYAELLDTIQHQQEIKHD